MKNPKALSALGILAMTTLFGIFSFQSLHMVQTCLSASAYYILLLLVVLWIGTLTEIIRKYKEICGNICRSCWKGWIFCIGLTVFIFISVKPSFRILADEANLLSVSKSMIEERKVEIVTEAKWYYYEQKPIGRILPKRHFLFPFLTHLLHAVNGYHEYHPFVLNFTILSLFFCGLFATIRYALGPPYGYAGILLVAAQPIISLTATSAGFDLLAASLTLLVFLTLYFYLRFPSEIHLRFLALNLVMVAYVRYEAFLLFVIVVTGLGLFKKIRYGDLSVSIVYPLIPLFFLVLIWQTNFIFCHYPDPLESGNQTTPFAVAHFLRHASLFVANLARFDFYYPYATLINAMGCLGLANSIILIMRKQILLSRVLRQSFALFAICLIALFITLCAFHEGSPNEPISSRYYTLFCIFFSLLALLFLRRMPFFSAKPGRLIAASLCLFLFYHPVAIRNQFLNTLNLPRAYAQVRDVLKKQDKYPVMIVTNYPVLYTVLNYASVDFSYANQNKLFLHQELTQRKYAEIYVIQEIDLKTSLPLPVMVLDPAFTLENIRELQHTPDTVLRISRIVPLSQEALIKATEEDMKEKLSPALTQTEGTSLLTMRPA